MPLPFLRRTLFSASSKSSENIARYEMDAIPRWICGLRLRRQGAFVAIPGKLNDARDINRALAQSLMLEMTDGHTWPLAQPALYGWLIRGYIQPPSRSIVFSGHFGSGFRAFPVLFRSPGKTGQGID